MRCVAGAGLLLLVGCNQIFGLTPARTWDASIDVPPDVPHVVFTWQLATSQPSGAPAPALSYPPFAPGNSPQIRIATLDGPFEHADYLTNPGMEGWIPIPRSYIGTTWRLEYTLPSGIPGPHCGIPLASCNVAHEVQWAPDDKLGHLTVPMVGRLDRGAVPDGSGYTVTPTNFSGAYTGPRILSTGLWTDGRITAPIVGSTVDYDFSSAQPLSGPVGQLDPTQGDRAMLVDFVRDTSPTNPCSRVAAGSAPVDAALLAGMHTPQPVTWDAGRKLVTAPPIDTAYVDRLTADPLHGSLSVNSLLLYGAVPSTDFPGLAGATPTLSQIPLSIPVMQILLQCPYNATPLPNTASPAVLDDFPRVLHVQLVAIRNSLGVDLTSGLETVIASSATAGFKIAFPAPMATKMTLTTPTGVINLSGTGDQIPIGSHTGTFTLAFSPEDDPDLRADYHDVILHTIAGGALTPVRIFTVTAPRVQIDGALLVPGTDYVFEIRTYKGHVMAAHGDFVPVDYPYGAAIVFTRTFKAS